MMKKRHILHWAMGVVMTPLLGSCAADDIGDAGRDGCDIILGQPMAVISVTRATDGRSSSNQFEANEEVWLWANKNDGSSTEYIKAWKLKAGSGGSFSSYTTGNDKYWPSDGSSLDVYALHGNFKNSPISEGTTSWSSLTALTHTVVTDQSSDENKRLSDLLYSHPSTAVAPNSGSVQLTFDHLLAKITVKLNLNDSQGIEASELASAEVTLTNMLTSGDFNSANVSNITTTGVSANASVSGEDIKAGVINQPPVMTSTAYEVGSAIVPLQDFGGGKSPSSDNNVITITLADGTSRSFSYKPTSIVTLAAGKEYIYTLKIINGELSVSSITVTGFTTHEEPKSWDDYVEPSGS